METLFDATPCLTEADLHQYVGQRLDQEDRFRVENHLLDCALCSEAVEGFIQAQDAGELPVGPMLNVLKAKLTDP